jgi:hypothetical protein
MQNDDTLRIYERYVIIFSCLLLVAKELCEVLDALFLVAKDDDAGLAFAQNAVHDLQHSLLLIGV